jgi:hypothetical protein
MPACRRCMCSPTANARLCAHACSGCVTGCLTDHLEANDEEVDDGPEVRPHALHFELRVRLHVHVRACRCARTHMQTQRKASGFDISMQVHVPLTPPPCM